MWIASGYRAAGGRLGFQLHVAPLILHCLIRARTRGVANFNKTAKGCILAGYKHLATFSVNSTRSSIIRVYTNNKLTAQRAVICASCTPLESFIAEYPLLLLPAVATKTSPPTVADQIPYPVLRILTGFTSTALWLSMKHSVYLC